MTSHRYFPHTPEDIDKMLGRCGAKSLDDLYSDVPSSLRLKAPYNLPDAMSEPELDRYFAKLSRENKELTIFAGAGFYHHYTPAVIPALLSRSEFYTAYTPYQPEISQGTLQYIFEYQSMMCGLTGMDVCNASMYDGATATAEAMIMAVSAAKKRNRVLISSTVAPAVREVCMTYAAGHGIQVDMIPEVAGAVDFDALKAMLAEGNVAGVVVATPNFYGITEDYTGFADAIHASKALLIINTHAAALGVLRSQAEWGADIACGEAQSLGMPLNYGGPGLGYLCCRKALMRKLPGRIVGATYDATGKRSFVLTLQAREQHIRRQKATSNICSNQGIMTLHAAIYLSLMGEDGLRTVNEIGYNGAHRLADELTATGKVELAYPARPYLNEFAVETKAPVTAAKLLAALENEGILGGVAIDENKVLIAVTEMCSPSDIDRYVSTVKAL